MSLLLEISSGNLSFDSECAELCFWSEPGPEAICDESFFIGRWHCESLGGTVRAWEKTDEANSSRKGLTIVAINNSIGWYLNMLYALCNVKYYIYIVVFYIYSY